MNSFNFSAGGLGAFPNVHRARVIWIGLDAPSDMAALQHSVEGVATRLGFPPEDRPFSPHLTIGRVGQAVSAADLVKIRTSLEACKIGSLGIIHVEALYLFKSDLQPAGSIYTHLYALPLKS